LSYNLAPFLLPLPETPSPDQGRNEGDTIPRAPKSPNNVASTFFNTVHLLSYAIVSHCFTPEELGAALRRLKPVKSPGLNSIFPVFILNAGSALKSCFCNFLTSCTRQPKSPKIWRGALIVAIPKPEKPLGDPKSYRPTSLLCVPFKILERLMYACVERKPIAPAGPGGLSTQEFDRRSGHPADTGHQG